MQKLTDDAVRHAKLSQIRSHVDFTSLLKKMTENGDASVLIPLINGILKPNTKKTFNLNSIDEALTMRPARYQEIEKVSVKKQKEIIFEDELEEKRIADNYVFIMKNLISALHKKEAFTLEEFNLSMKNMYSENVLKNADYFSFFVNLCQKKKHITGGADMDSESFMDDILKKYFENEAPVVFSIDEGNGKMLELMDGCEVSDVTFHREDYSN